MITVQELYRTTNKIVVWGGGGAFFNNYDEMFRVDYIIDSDINKQNTTVKGLTIYSPEKLLSEDMNTLAVIIVSAYWKEILKQMEVMELSCKVYLPDMLVPNPFAIEKPKKSFSLFGEDAIIEGLSLRYGIKIEHYIDVGANHPLYGNATMSFYLKGATGCLVEPNDEYIEILKMFRPKDTVLHMGISDDSTSGKEITYYKIDELVCRNTFSDEVADKYRNLGYQVIDEQIKVSSLNCIMEEYNKKVNYISVDVEGFEWQVFKDFEFKKYDVEIFNVEKGEERVKQLMFENDYVIAGETLSNWIFLKQELIHEI